MKDAALLLLVYLNKIMKMTLDSNELELTESKDSDDSKIFISDNYYIQVSTERSAFIFVQKIDNKYLFSDELNATQVIDTIEQMINLEFIRLDNYRRVGQARK